jgi:hypothetical protein
MHTGGAHHMCAPLHTCPLPPPRPHNTPPGPHLVVWVAREGDADVPPQRGGGAAGRVTAEEVAHAHSVQVSHLKAQLLGRETQGGGGG